MMKCCEMLGLCSVLERVLQRVSYITILDTVMFKVYMTDFFLFARLNLPNALLSMAKKNSIAIFLPLFWCTKSVKFHFRWGTKLRDQEQETGTIVTSFKDSKPREKQISPTFSYFLINNALLYYFLANLLAHSKKMTEKSFFSRGLESWNDVTIVPSLLCFVSRYCTPPEVKFDTFGTSKIAIEKVFLLYLSVHWADLIGHGEWIGIWSWHSDADIMV